MHIHRLALLLFLVPACGGHSDPGGDVVGSWRMLPSDSTTPTGDREVVSFAADGTWTSVDGDTTEHGTYTIADGVLTVEAPQEHHVLTYFADDQRMILDAMQPDDDGDDAVATWTGHVVDNDATEDLTIVLHDDHTAHFDALTGGKHDAVDGTWSQDGDWVTMTIAHGDFTTTTHAMLYDGFLGTPLEKI
jgi:hypothetical protein